MTPETGGSPVRVASAAAGRSAAGDVTEVKVATAVGSREADGFTTGFTILKHNGSNLLPMFQEHQAAAEANALNVSKLDHTKKDLKNSKFYLPTALI
jgi:hypothetical protein